MTNANSDRLRFRESRFPDGFVCSRCQGRSVMRYGHERSGLQRYYCKVCRRTFNDRTATPMARTRKPTRWAGFAICMREAYSCRRAATELGVDHKTVLAWRHRVLASVAATTKAPLTGVVDADEMTFRRSFKGSTPIGRPARNRGRRGHNKRPRGQGEDKAFVIVTRNREARTASFVMDKVANESLIAQVGPALSPTVLCTDGSQALATFARTRQFEHIAFPSSGGHPKRDIYQTQNVNAYHARFDQWMDRLRGVATKYLHRYADWHIIWERATHWSVGEITRTLLASASPAVAASGTRTCPCCGAVLTPSAAP